MKHKRILIIGVLLLSLTFTGCQRGVVTSDSNINSFVSQSVSETRNEESYETVAVPEGDWTAEELAKTIRINGKPVEIPFTVESLGADYQLDEKISSWDENKKTLTSSLLYKGDAFITVYISGVKNNSFKEARLSEVVRFGFFHTDNIDINKMLSINNIHIGFSDSVYFFAIFST